MSRERFEERQQDVAASAPRLLEVASLPDSDVVRDATIQRFEFTFEVTWKTLLLWLEHQGHQCAGPRSALRKSFAEGILPTAAEADLWLRMLEDRNLTTHAYDEALARSIYSRIVSEYAPALQLMAARIAALRWE